MYEIDKFQKKKSLWVHFFKTISLKDYLTVIILDLLKMKQNIAVMNLAKKTLESPLRYALLGSSLSFVND